MGTKWEFLNLHVVTTVVGAFVHYIYFLNIDFHNYECLSYLKQLLTPPQGKIIVAYDNANHRLAIEIGRGRTIPIFENLCHVCSYNVIENEAHFVLECLLYMSIGDKFPSLFENVVLGSLGSFVQLDH